MLKVSLLDEIMRPSGIWTFGLVPNTSYLTFASRVSDFCLSTPRYCISVQYDNGDLFERNLNLQYVSTLPIRIWQCKDYDPSFWCAVQHGVSSHPDQNKTKKYM